MPLVEYETFRRLCRARDFLSEGYADRITLERAAREACLSPFHFQRLFRRTFGETPQEFLTRRRMDAAKELLADGAPVTDVCLTVGYSSMGTFSSRFTSLVGDPPSVYGRKARRWIAPIGGWRIYRVPTCFVAYWLESKPQD